MLLVDSLFWLSWTIFLFTVSIVLYVLRKKPLYEPRVIFSFAALLWLVIGYGYHTGFEGYLAAKPDFYTEDISTLASKSMLLLVVGYVAFVIGSSVNIHAQRIAGRAPRSGPPDTLRVMAYLMLILALINFAVNVVLISGGDVIGYMATTAGRKYQIASGLGISAIGYLFGFLGAQFLCYLAGNKYSHSLTLIVAIVLAMLIVKLSQGRIFQSLVFVGACYVAFRLGVTHRTGRTPSYMKDLGYLAILGLLGVILYFLRIASALYFMGRPVGSETVSNFLSKFVHYAVERGNVPNFPVLFTLLDKMPAESEFLHGSSLFNWLLYFVPKDVLPADYLISLWVKNTWYQDVPGGGLPPTAIGEWYANFGYLGVPFGMFLVGLIMRFIYNLAMRSKSPYFAVLWANLSFGFLVIYPKTDLAQLPVFTFVILVGTWIGVKALDTFRPGNYAQ